MSSLPSADGHRSSPPSGPDFSSGRDNVLVQAGSAIVVYRAFRDIPLVPSPIVISLQYLLSWFRCDTANVGVHRDPIPHYPGAMRTII